MKHPRLLIFYIVLMIVSGCAKHISKTDLIADLKIDPIIAPHEKTAPIISESEIFLYKSVSKGTTDNSFSHESLRRWADIELESAEIQINDENENRENAGNIQTSIELYIEYLNKFQESENIDIVLYQLAKAYDLSGQIEKSLFTLTRLIDEHPNNRHKEEALFRTGEMYFSLHRYSSAETAFQSIITQFPQSIFFDRSLYMRGWSLYLGGNFDESLETFLHLLDIKLDNVSPTMITIDGLFSHADSELIEDSLKVICLIFSLQEDKDPIVNYFSHHKIRTYEALIHRRLGEFYLEKERFNDAAYTFLGLARSHPNHSLSPVFHQYAIDAYQDGGFTDLLLSGKSRFIQLYGIDSSYWKTHDESVHEQIYPYLEVDIRNLATHYHAMARRKKSGQDLETAAEFYKKYLITFPHGDNSAEMNFLLAECLYEAEHLNESASEYEKTAYQYPQNHRSENAAYAALSIYWEIMNISLESDIEAWRQKILSSTLKFVEQFPHDERSDSALLKITENLYSSSDYVSSMNVIRVLLRRETKPNNPSKLSAWILMGHAQFESEDYIGAEHSYRTALTILEDDDFRRRAVVDNLAASLYKQAEHQRHAGKLDQAISLFLDIKHAAPTSSIWITAQYDAALLLIQLQEWSPASVLLEKLREFPLEDTEMKKSISEKLAYIYIKSGQKSLAAREMEALARASLTADYRRDLILETADLYRDIKQINDAIRLYETYVREFPDFFPASIEARHELSLLYRELGKSAKSQFWLREIIRSDQSAGALRTERSRFLAGMATLSLAETQLQAYMSTKITLPLDKSLKLKKSLMEKAIDSYTNALNYQLADISTAATYQLGDIYRHFAQSLLSSDKPQGLSDDEIEQYDILMEEQAYLFEEKAIELHEANAHHIMDGLYNDWIKASLKALSDLYPIRYAKTEISEAFYDATQ